MTGGQFQQSSGAQTGQQYAKHPQQQSRGIQGQQQGAMTQGGQHQGQQLTESISRAVDVCSWCADQCIQESNPQMVECIRLCEDVAEIGEAAVAMLPRDSRFGQDILQTFQQSVQACAQECAQHQAGHCQECAQTLGQTMQAVQQGMGATQSGGMQSGGMQSGGMQGGATQGF